MKTIEQSVIDAFAGIVASGKIEAAIEAQLTRTINDAVQEHLRSYSDFGKQLSEAVKSALKVDLRDLGLPGYNDLILKVIRAQLDGHINTVLAEQVEQQMASLLQPAPAEIKLSELIKQFIEEKASDDCSCGGHEHISLHVGEVSHGSRWIGLDEAPGKSEYSCEIRFGVSSDGGIFGLRLNDKDMGKTMFVGSIYGFERSLFQLSVAGTKVIIDGDSEDDFDTSYPGHD